MEAEWLQIWYMIFPSFAPGLQNKSEFMNPRLSSP